MRHSRVAQLLITGCAALALLAPAGMASAAKGGPSAPAGATDHLVEVKGGVPKVNGPTDHYTEGAAPTSDVTVQTVWALPFNYTFTDVSWGIDGRDFVTSTGKACNWLAVTKTNSAVPYIDYFPVSLYEGSTKIGPTGTWAWDGRTYVLCWTGLQNGHTYHFHFGLGSAGNGATFDGTGSVTAS